MSEKDEKRLTLEELAGGKEPKEVTIDTVSDDMISKYGAKEKPVRYDSHLHEVIETYGKQASDEVFEQAKNIVQDKYVDLGMEGKLKGQDGEDIIDEDLPFTDDIIEDVDTLDDIELTDDIDVQLKYKSYDEVVSNNASAVDIEDVEEVSPNENIKFKSYEDEYDSEGSVDDLIDDLESEFDDDLDSDQIMEIVKSKVKEKIKPVTDKIDLDSFTISNKPISVLDAFGGGKDATVNVSDWVLYNTGIPISMKEMSGHDIERLNPQNSRRNEYNTYKAIYSIIYSHIINTNKPSLEEFLKLVKFSDIKHLYFNIYRSSFGESNILTYSCGKGNCNEIFVEDVNIDDMYRFANKNVEKEFNRMLEDSEGEFLHTEYESTLLQISDDYMIGIKEPSIYNVIFEPASLDDDFREKYEDVLSILTYVDAIYFIDRDTKTLSPISLKTYKNSLSKTVKYKILQYAKIINSLTSDQYYNLTTSIGNIINTEDIEYFIPEQVCPKCKAKVEEEIVSPESMLFTRHQLAALATI